MVSWATIGYQMGHDSIVRAYRESRRTFENEIINITAQLDQSQEASTSANVERDEDRAFSEHLIDVAWEAEESLKTLREAFILVVYHFWENQARIHLRLEGYSQEVAFTKARERADFVVDEAGINRLRMIVNCIKHGGRKSLYEAAPDLFDKDLINAAAEDPDYRIALRLQDKDIDAAFAAVRSSGPKSKEMHEPIQELEL